MTTGRATLRQGISSQDDSGELRASASLRRIAQDDALALGDRVRRVLMPRLVPMAATYAAFVVVALLVFRLVEIFVLACADTSLFEATRRKARRGWLPAWC